MANPVDFEISGWDINDLNLYEAAKRAHVLEPALIEQLKDDQQKHALLLFASGHKLAFDKCSFYWIKFIREGLKQRHCMNHEEPGELYVKEGYGHEEKRIKRMRKTKQMEMAMLMPILIGTFWYFFSKRLNPI